MKKLKITLMVFAFCCAFIASCTPENQIGDAQQDDVDKTKIERPGDQGGG